MLKTSFIMRISVVVLASFALILSACQPIQSSPTTESQTQIPASETSIVTIEPSPTATAIPAAAKVNGEIIPLTYFQNEVLRFQDAYPDSTDANQKVLDSLIDQLLLAQAARQGGFSISAAELQAKIDGLVAELGSGGALTNWMQANHYDDAEFRTSLALASESAWERDQITASVPDSMDQVHARQIFAVTQAGADRALAALKSGNDFDALAWEFSPKTGGELGWFPRGYLLYPQIEEAAFTLPVGSYSDIIPSEIGFHIIMVIEHTDHPLTTDAKLALQAKALSDWLSDQRAKAVIEISIP